MDKMHKLKCTKFVPHVLITFWVLSYLVYMEKQTFGILDLHIYVGLMYGKANIRDFGLMISLGWFYIK